MTQKENDNYPPREVKNKTVLACRVPVFTPKNVSLTNMEATIIDRFCRELEATTARVKAVNLNPDRDDADRLHNIVFSIEDANKALKAEERE